MSDSRRTTAGPERLAVSDKSRQDATQAELTTMVTGKKILPPKVSVGIRAMGSLDLKSVLRIEQNSTGRKWSMAAFEKRFRSEDHVVLVAVYDSEVVAYLSYRKYVRQGGDWAVVERMTVDEECRRHGIGSQMLWAVIDRSAFVPNCQGVGIVVNERQLDQQLFLRTVGFACTFIVEADAGRNENYIFELEMARGE